MSSIVSRQSFASGKTTFRPASSGLPPSIQSQSSQSDGVPGSEAQQQALSEGEEPSSDWVEAALLVERYAKSSWGKFPWGLIAAVTQPLQIITDGEGQDQSPVDGVIGLGADTAYIRREIKPTGPASANADYFILLAVTTQNADYLIYFDKSSSQDAHHALLNISKPQNAYTVFKKDHLEGRSQTAAELLTALNLLHSACVPAQGGVNG
jgi:hypothetical protein